MTSNLVTTTPSRFSVIQPSLLPPMQVLQSIDTEQIIVDRMTRLVQIWASYDPPNAAQYDVGATEFDPIRINQELNAYFELLVRDRVNQATRAITLVYAVGGDLDAIGSRYPYGMPRNPGETDTAYRQRIWLSPNILSLNGPGQGTYESYVFWAMSAPQFPGELPIKHASALTKPGTGNVYIVLISDVPIPSTWKVSIDKNTWTLACGADPTPTSNQIEAVYEYITEPNTARKGLTDIINVIPPKVTQTDIKVQLWLFPGVDPAAMMQEISDAVFQLVLAIRWLGADLTTLSLEGALAQVGVYRTNIISPSTDVVVGIDGVVNVKTITLINMGFGE